MLPDSITAARVLRPAGNAAWHIKRHGGWLTHPYVAPRTVKIDTPIALGTRGVPAIAFAISSKDAETVRVLLDTYPSIA